MEAAALIRDWSQRGQGFFGTLKQALAGGRFSDAFDRLRGELAERLTDMQLYLAVRVAVDTAGWAREDERADAEDRAALPAAIASEADDDAALTDMLRAVGMDVAGFKAALAGQGMSLDAVLASLAEMEARQAAHNAKLDKLLSVLQAGTQLREKPADLIEWGDIRVQEERVVGAGGFGRVYIGVWKGAAVAVKALAETNDAAAVRKVYHEANVMAAVRARRCALFAPCEHRMNATAAGALTCGSCQRTPTWCATTAASCRSRTSRW